ncbi:MAG: hypothetical protein IKO72_16070 [Kiritimatiellae bacterium]|nr:hypothetical protein [Kiritimatiellia bacterium]
MKSMTIAMCIALPLALNASGPNAVARQAFHVGLPEEELADTWGARKAHPAVVNPALGYEPGTVVSLRGEWEFFVPEKERPWRNGVWKHLYKSEWPGSRRIQVPGCWEAQGVGKPGMSISWDPTWDENSKMIRYKHMGRCWYRKTVAIPSSWSGRRIWLKIGGVKSRGWFWVNDRQVALVDNYCGTYKYEVTDLVTPGSNATVVAQVSNLAPSRKGLLSAMHRWGGIYRDVEFESTPHVFIDDAWVRGAFDEKAADVHVDMAFGEAPSSRSAVHRTLRVAIGGAVEERTVAPGGSQVVRVKLPDFRAWSPEHPNLYTARVDLVENGKVVHTRRERFGVRKIEVRGKEFFLNGKPHCMRGFGDDHIYPISGITPADHAEHRSHLGRAREAGFNFVRLHTHCEVPEYFDAADELGIMIQAELPYYSDEPTEGFEFDPKRDVTELYRNFRRHVSFTVYSMGNEGSYGEELDRRLHAYVKAMDPDRLKINQDCNQEWINPPDASDYLGGPIKPWNRGSVNPDRPFVTHEYLNLCIKSDARDESLYTGVWVPPVTRKARKDWLAPRGLDLAWDDRLQDAQNRLQRHYQKRGIEWARKDPYCDGYCFWTIVDVVVGQNDTFTAQGLFNPFWQTKRGGFTVAEFARFNGPSCLLMDTPDENRVYTSGENLNVDFLFAHYGEAPIRDARLSWRLMAGGAALRQGEVSIKEEIGLGPARKVASVRLDFPALEKPVKATLEANVGEVSNSWDFWLFPKRARRDGRDLAVAPSLRAAMEKLYDGFSIIGTPGAAGAKVAVVDDPSCCDANGGGVPLKVVVVNPAKGVPNVSLGWWWMGNQVGTAMLRHPVLGYLPHDGYLSPLLFRILGRGRALNVEPRYKGEFFMVGEGGSDCFVYLARRAIGSCDVLESFGLDLLSGKPEGTAILDGMIDFLRQGTTGD